MIDIEKVGTASKVKRDKARRERLRARIAELKLELKEVGKYD